MKITDIKVWHIEGIKYNWTMLKIYTDEGITGVGEATNWPESRAVFEATKSIAKRIIGEDPLRTDYIWSKLYRDLNWIGPHGISLCAISGIDMALLDLKAKHYKMPLYDLLGGAFRKDILLYANYWFTKGDFSPEDYGKAAKTVKEAGFTGCKFDPFAHTNYLYGDDLSANLSLSPKQQDHAYNVTKAVREAMGDDADLMIETHAMLNFKTTIEMAQRLSDLGITWYEEPVGPENIDTLAAVRKRVPANVPLCVGERHYTRYGIRPVLEQQLVDVIMPDITRCGGPSELKRMATMAETYNIQVAPHNPNGPLSTLASAHVCATLPNFFRQEFMFADVSWRDEVLTYPIDVQNGYLKLSDRSGLGVDLIEEEMEKHPAISFEDVRAGKRQNFYA
ncbi:MAG: mandelate racemase/muconate lactonizing enzyme family protein [Alphaproteobacteria bacterium]